MGILRKLEKRIDDVVKRVALGSGGQVEPLEVRRAILDELEGKIISLGGGRRVFPFDRIRVRLLAPDSERRALYEFAFVKGDALADTVRRHLAPPRCEEINDLETLVEVVEDADAGAGHRIEYDSRRPEAEQVEEGKRGLAHLVVTHGTAEPAQYSITKKRTNIGRQAEVLDSDGLPLRRNDLVFFEDGGEINQTVSRIHAHINYDPGVGEYRLHDDDSAYGTVIIRSSGSRVKVTRALGAALHPGDEICFGQARVVFENE